MRHRRCSAPVRVGGACRLGCRAGSRIHPRSSPTRRLASSWSASGRSRRGPRRGPKSRARTTTRRTAPSRPRRPSRQAGSPEGHPVGDLEGDGRSDHRHGHKDQRLGADQGRSRVQGPGDLDRRQDARYKTGAGQGEHPQAGQGVRQGRSRQRITTRCRTIRCSRPRGHDGFWEFVAHRAPAALSGVVRPGGGITRVGRDNCTAEP